METGPPGQGLWGDRGLSLGGHGMATPMGWCDTVHSHYHHSGCLSDDLGTVEGQPKSWLQWPDLRSAQPGGSMGFGAIARASTRQARPGPGPGATLATGVGTGETPSLCSLAQWEWAQLCGPGPTPTPWTAHWGRGRWPLCPLGAGTSWGPVPLRSQGMDWPGGRRAPTPGFQQLRAAACPLPGLQDAAPQPHGPWLPPGQAAFSGVLPSAWDTPNPNF